MNILGLSCFYHDAAAVLLQDGDLVAAVEEERFSRVKHDHSFPQHAINYCLSEGGITTQDIDYVVFYEKPLLKFERILSSTLGSYPMSWGVFRESMITWFNDKLWIKGQILGELGVEAEKLLFVEHHLSHAASTFFASPYKEAAILTVDGVGEWTTTTIGKATADWDGSGENTIDLLKEIKYPHSLGLLYSAFTAFLGFRVNNGEYKVMGMAPYGKATRIEDVHKVIRVEPDGSFDLNMDYFSFHRSTHRTFSSRFEQLFGEPRVHDSVFYTATTHPNGDHPDWDREVAAINQNYADVAASIQAVTEDTLLKMCENAHHITGSNNLCLAGGVALNSVANGRIMRESSFDSVFVQPAPGDSGGALGAALYAYHVLLGNKRKFVQEHAYLGKQYTSDEIKNTLEYSGIHYKYFDNDDVMAESMASDLNDGKVISVARGRFEWGPRALGNRSILADPRRDEMKEIVNTKIKFREPFRPFAPAILERFASDYYQLSDAEKLYPLRYMLAVYPTKNDKGSNIPAVTHFGGTGRVQTVRNEWNTLYHSVIEKFWEKTGVPVVLNTSFNLRGEPIVNTPSDAISTFSRSGID
ncbi:MAG TPA: carbamoyltransferase N-terminal domain-containing protein, partial [Anaerolineales bacterium]|nr:carbamoyltransferase N-terminal domain-containing protein [Anaerolineales bacterium]